MASLAELPIGFHYETKYVVLSYLGFPSQERPREQPLISLPGVSRGIPGPTSPPTVAKEELDKVKAVIEEELKQLEDEIAAAFHSTGFDMHTSPVFSPVNPESSIEECLAQLSEKLSLEIQEPVEKALEKLLSESLTYEAFSKEADETALLTSGWNKVFVPLIVLQRLLLELTRRGEHRLESIVQLGVTYIERVSSDYIIKQGGWGTVFSLVSEEEEVRGLIAEDSNDIYILPSDNSEQVSPPESLLAVSESWQTESLPTTSLGPESWQQVVMDPEELKSLDSNEGAEERSENNSSNSDIVHVEKEEIAEVIAEAAVIGEPSAEEEEDEDEEREILVAPSVVTAPLMASLPPAPEQESESPSPPTPLAELPRVDTATKDESENIPSLLPFPDKEVIQPTSPSDPEKLEPPVPKPLYPPPHAAEEKPVLLPEGKSILLYGGAAAIAILAVAVGMVMLLRKK